MLRPCAALALSLMLTAPAPVMAAPDTGSKEAGETQDKTQSQLKEAVLLEVQAWRLASQFYVYGAKGKTAAELSQLQKLRTAGNRLAGCCGSDVRHAWEQVAGRIADSTLDADGKPSPATHQKISDALTDFSTLISNHAAETRKSAKLPVKSPSEPLKDASVQFEKLVFNHFAADDEAEQRKLLAQVNARFDKLNETYTLGDTGKAVQSACAKWPVLREALTKGKDKNPVFMISRFHDQVATDLNSALESQPRY